MKSFSLLFNVLNKFIKIFLFSSSENAYELLLYDLLANDLDEDKFLFSSGVLFPE